MYKKMLAVLMASAVLFVMAGCDFPWESSSDNGSSTAEESAVSEESENDTETTDNSSENSSGNGAAEDTEEPAEPMEVQEDGELQLEEGQEGAW